MPVVVTIQYTKDWQSSGGVARFHIHGPVSGRTLQPRTVVLKPAVSSSGSSTLCKPFHSLKSEGP